MIDDVTMAGAGLHPEEISTIRGEMSGKEVIREEMALWYHHKKLAKNMRFLSIFFIKTLEESKIPKGVDTKLKTLFGNDILAIFVQLWVHEHVTRGPFWVSKFN